MAGNFKLTQAVFIERVKALHPTLDFTNTLYVNARTEATFVCPEHGEQKIKAAKLLEGRGCPLCGRSRSGQANAERIAEVGRQRMAALSPEEKAAQAAKARAGRTEESNQKIAAAQRKRWATDEAGKAAQSERGKRVAAAKWAGMTPEQRKEAMAAVRAAKHDQ